MLLGDDHGDEALVKHQSSVEQAQQHRSRIPNSNDEDDLAIPGFQGGRPSTISATLTGPASRSRGLHGRRQHKNSLNTNVGTTELQLQPSTQKNTLAQNLTTYFQYRNSHNFNLLRVREDLAAGDVLSKATRDSQNQLSEHEYAVSSTGLAHARNTNLGARDTTLKRTNDYE